MAKETDAFSHILYTLYTIQVFTVQHLPQYVCWFIQERFILKLKDQQISAKTLQNLTLTLGINNSKSELCKNSLKKLGLAVYELFKSSSLSAHEKEMEQCRN